MAEAAAKVPVPKPETLRYKSDDAFKYIGKPIPVVDLHDFVTGDTTYGMDVDLPGMVYASIQRCPVLGGELKSLDSKAALAVIGVSDVIKIDRTPLPAAFSPITGVAVIANNT